MKVTLLTGVLSVMWLGSYSGFYLVRRRLYGIRQAVVQGITNVESLQTGRYWLRTTFLVNFSSLFLLLVVLSYKLTKSFDGLTYPNSTTTLYETRSILGYGETVAIASVAVFLPLLVLLWNSSQDAVSSVIEDLATLCGKIVPSNTLADSFTTVMVCTTDDESSKSHLKRSIRLAYIDFEYLKAIGDSLRGPFAVTIVVIFGLFALLITANFQWWWPPGKTYLSMVALKGMASAIFLWLLTLLSIYLWFVQPVVRETRYLDIFEVKRHCVGTLGGAV